jgi:hypothetical protein
VQQGAQIFPISFVADRVADFVSPEHLFEELQGC